jgi:hypothetical protein
MERGRRMRASNRYALKVDTSGDALTQGCSNWRRCLALHQHLRIVPTIHEGGVPTLSPTIAAYLPSAPPIPPRDPPHFLKAPAHDKQWLNVRALYPASTPSFTPGSTFLSRVKCHPNLASIRQFPRCLVLWHSDGGNNLFVGVEFTTLSLLKL